MIGHSLTILADRPECPGRLQRHEPAAKRTPHGRRQFGPCLREIFRLPLSRVAADGFPHQPPCIVHPACDNPVRIIGTFPWNSSLRADLHPLLWQGVPCHVVSRFPFATVAWLWCLGVTVRLSAGAGIAVASSGMDVAAPVELWLVVPRLYAWGMVGRFFRGMASAFDHPSVASSPPRVGAVAAGAVASLAEPVELWLVVPRL